MKILYGVQATGQGHISRARAMAAALAKHPVSVDWLFSGRREGGLFDMQPFGSYRQRRGLTFSTCRGRISYLRTAIDNDPRQFLRDIAQLDTRAYDLVVTDFEPVSAWAARRQGTRSIGIGHQYAFYGRTPQAGANWLTRAIMKNFAPADLQLGLHWARYNDTILPPILDLPASAAPSGDHVLVYLPFEDQDEVSRLLQRVDGRFVQYAPGLAPATAGNVLRRPASIREFKQHLLGCRAVICNSGFELNSECLQLGKPVLTRPVIGQAEQLSNALALRQAGLASILTELDVDVIQRWVSRPIPTRRQQFPDVASALAQWLAEDCSRSPEELSSMLWRGASAGSQLAMPAAGTPANAIA
jgi:uncharacterized protein (TIGR00661 family)